MRTARLVLLLAVSLSALGLTALASLEINRFDVTIILEPSGILRITEELTVTFHTPHHGIEREIPVSYRDPRGANVTIDLDIERIAQDGGPVPYTARRVGRDLRLRIGDPDRTITGSYAYAIAYTVGRAIVFHDDYLQLYWNVTGNDWRIPIRNATATVALPEAVDRASLSTISYAGYAGSTARGGPATLSAAGELLFAADHLSPGEGLTIDVSIPRDQLPIEPPSITQQALWFLDANKVAALPILALVGMILLWSRVGKDPRKRTIAPAFEPPHGMHPGEAGVLIDDRADLRDLSAMLIGLAVKGQLTIEEVDKAEGLTDRVKELFGRSVTEYRFVRRPDSTEGLSEVETLLLATLFDQDHPEARTLSSLENQFYKHLPTIKSKLYGGLIEKNYYPHNPERTRRLYTSIGFMGLAAGGAIGVAASSLYLGIAVALCGLIVLAFSPIMPRKTKQGVRALEELLGLSEYIQRAEVDRIEYHDAPEKSPKLFERLLPYAIALNLTSLWTKQFEGLLDEPPDWYVGHAPVFRAHLFGLSILHLTSGMERSFASAPRTASSGRSAWSGRSTFGGGFSGGGFGGGGGGGW
jgi:uncharacterized membrane protein YgcG